MRGAMLISTAWFQGLVPDMPAANWKARREALLADARRGKPVIPQPAPDEEENPWAIFLLFIVVTLFAFCGVMVVAAISSGRL